MTRQKKLCAADGCEVAARCRGWCDVHYARWYRTRSVELLAERGGTCRIPACNNRVCSQRLCLKHYQRWVTWGDPLKVTKIPTIPLSLAERAWRYIKRDPDTGCWNWTGAIANGYGRTKSANRRDENAHRAMYELLVEPIPDGLHLDHLCRNRACVNPSHMEPVTPRENVQRGESGIHNRNKTACKHGHPFTPENTILRRDGRQCRTCSRIASRRYKRRQREQRRVS